MPNRYIREGWIRSRRLALVSAMAERLFVRLCLVADDFGRYLAEPAIVRCGCYPRQLEGVTEAEVARCIDELARAKLIGVYHDGEDRLLQIFNFRQRTRRTSKYPAPPAEVLASMGEPDDTPARADASPANGAPTARGRRANGRPMARQRRAAGAPTAGRRAAGIGSSVAVNDHGYGCGSTGSDEPPPTLSDPVHQVTRDSVVIPIHHEPPAPRRPDGGCPTCLDILAHFAERTARSYPLAGKIAERLHRAHLEHDAETCKRIIDQQHARAADGTDPRGWEFLAPQIVFEPANFARLVNADVRPETDEERGRRRMREINREMGIRS